jgi:hypothetical protein
MKVADYFRAPFVIRATSVRREDGEWIRRVECPELPGCAVESHSILEAVDAIERLRIEVILKMLSSGTPPVVSRHLRNQGVVRAELRRINMLDSLEKILDWEADALQSSDLDLELGGQL